MVVIRPSSLWLDNGMCVVWRQTRRAVVEPTRTDDGNRNCIIVDKLLLGPASASAVIQEGDKLVSVTIGDRMYMVVGVSMLELRRLLESLEGSQIVGLELQRVEQLFRNNSMLEEESLPRGTYSVRIKVSDERPSTAGMSRSRGGSRAVTPGGMRQSARPPTSDRRPGSRGVTTSRGGERPHTTSWMVTDNGADPRSTRALNATRFERLLFMANKRIKDKALVELLSSSYSVDRPSTSSKGLAGSPGKALRPCYRLQRWWKASEQSQIMGLLLRLNAYLTSVRDVVDILREHLESASRMAGAADGSDDAVAAQRLQAVVRAVLVRVAFGWEIGESPKGGVASPAGSSMWKSGVPEPMLLGDNAELLVVDEEAGEKAEEAGEKEGGGKEEALSKLGGEAFEKLSAVLGEVAASLAYNNIAADSDDGYEAFDMDADGQVSLGDLVQTCAELRLTGVDCEWLFEQLGGTPGGSISRRAWAEALSMVDPSEVLKARGGEEGGAPVAAQDAEQDALDLIAAALSFNGVNAEAEGYDCFDLDSDGAVTLKDFEQSCESLQLELTPAALKAVWQLLDSTRSGMVQRETWAVYMRTTQVERVLRARGVEEGEFDPHFEMTPSNSPVKSRAQREVLEDAVRHLLGHVVATAVFAFARGSAPAPSLVPHSGPDVIDTAAEPASAAAPEGDDDRHEAGQQLSVMAWLDIGNEDGDHASPVAALPSTVAWMPASPTRLPGSS